MQGHKMPGGENFVESDSVTFTRVTRKHAGIYKYATIMIIIVVDNFVIMITIIIVIISIALHCDTTQVHNVTQCNSGAQPAMDTVKGQPSRWRWSSGK